MKVILGWSEGHRKGLCQSAQPAIAKHGGLGDLSNRHLSLTGLEAAGVRSGCQQGQVGGSPLPNLHMAASCFIFTWQRDSKSDFSGVLL